MFNKNYLNNNLNDFLKIYKKRPIKYNRSGMKIEHCYALYCFLKKIKPKIIIESGIWKGQTTWLIKQILKKSIIYSIDINLSQREIIYKDVNYLDKDITEYDWSHIDKNNTVIIFDDHVCFSKRINFLIKNKFKKIIFDDNLPNGYIGYYTPKMIIEKTFLKEKKFIKYSNLKRFISFLFKYLIGENKLRNSKINFYSKFLLINYPTKKNKKLIKDFSLIRKKILNYYEFPPIIKFDFKKRFKSLIDNYNIELNEKKYIVKKPITEIKKIKIDKNLLKEFSDQYSNICFISLK